MTIARVSSLRSIAIYPWLVWLLGASFFFYKYLIQVSPSVMTNDLMREFHVNGTGLGNLSACFFYAYLIMQIPVGILLDKYSQRLLTTVAILICSVSILLFANTDSLWVASISRAFMGFGAAFAAVSCFKAAAVWFPPRRFALVSGMCMTTAMLGAVGGQLPLSLLVQQFSWRSALEMIGLAGMVLSLFYYAIIQDKSKESNTPTHIHVFASLKSIIFSKQAWLLSLYSGLAFAPVSVFGGLWGVPFLEEAYHLTPSEAALSVSWVFIGFAIGAPLLGWLSDHLGRRKPIMYLGTCIALISLFSVLYASHLFAGVISLLLFIFGIGASGFFISFAMIREVFPLGLAATVLGFMNTFDSVCEAISEPFVGILLDTTWDGRIVNNVHQFSLHSYHSAMIILPIYLISALIMLWLIDETFCKSS